MNDRTHNSGDFDDLDLSHDEADFARSLRSSLAKVAASSPTRVPPFDDIEASRADNTVVVLRRSRARSWGRVVAAAAAVTLVVGVGAMLLNDDRDAGTDLALEATTPSSTADGEIANAGVPEVAVAPDADADAAITAAADDAVAADAAADAAAGAAAAVDEPAVAPSENDDAVVAKQAPAPSSSRATTKSVSVSASTRSTASAQPASTARAPASAPVSSSAALPAPIPAPAVGTPVFTDGDALYEQTLTGSSGVGVSFAAVRLPNDTSGAKGQFPVIVLSDLPAGAQATSSLNGLLRSDIERFASELAADSKVETIGGTIGRVTVSSKLVVVERTYLVTRKDTTPALDGWPGALVVDVQSGRILEARELFTAAALEEMASRLSADIASKYSAAQLKSNAADVTRTLFRAVASDNRACCAVAPRSDGVLVSIDGSYVLADPRGEVLSTLVPWSALDGLIASTSPVADRLAEAESLRG
jgi:hypothetical protein